MKRIISVLAVLVFCVPIFAQGLSLSGEVKTGVLWESDEYNFSEDPTKSIERERVVRIGSQDYAGEGEGRFRLDADYLNAATNIGFKVRLNWERWSGGGNSNVFGYTPDWTYAFGYGNFFNDQLIVSAGKLGLSPWGINGREIPEEYWELETISRIGNLNYGGMRFEYKPNFIQGLNVGFVINNFDENTDAKRADLTILEIFKESIIGVSYENDYVASRLAVRLDSNCDRPRTLTRNNYIDDGKTIIESINVDGLDLVYHLEERILGLSLQGFQISAYGYYFGLGSDDGFMTDNWLINEYDQGQITASLGLGYKGIKNRSELSVKPSFFYHFFERLFSVGAYFTYCRDFGDDKTHAGSPFFYIQAEPELRINFNENAYLSFAYLFENRYMRLTQAVIEAGKDDYQRTRQWMNLRVGMTF